MMRGNCEAFANQDAFGAARFLVDNGSVNVIKPLDMIQRKTVNETV